MTVPIVFSGPFMARHLRQYIQFAIAAAAFVLLFLLAFGVPGRANDTDAAMNGAMLSSQIQRAVIGKKLDWKSLDGSLGVFGKIVFEKDGRVEMTTNLPGLPSDEGKWWFDDNRICTRWSAARDGEAKCYRLIDQGSGRFLTTGGNLFELGGDPMV